MFTKAAAPPISTLRAAAPLCVQMSAMVAETEKDAIPVSDAVRVIMEAATAQQPKVSDPVVTPAWRLA